MDKYSLTVLYVALGFGMLIVLLTNLYWGTFIILLAQPLFITTLSGGAGTGATKIVYGALFAIWFGAWALKPVARDSATPKMRSLVRTPALAFGVLLGIAILLGFIYGASLDDIIRDLSQYVGYLAVLPLLTLAHTPKQAKRLVFFLALLGLPCFIVSSVYGIAGKQQEEISHSLSIINGAQAYWGPIQGALWVVAVSFPGFAVMVLAWAWLVLTAAASVFSGVRNMLLIVIISAGTAFLITGRIARQRLARYMIPVLLIVMVGGVLADLSGIVKLPLSNITRDRYSTLVSGKKFEQDDSMRGRFMESRALFKMFLQNPITGIGLGHALKDKNIPGGGFRFHNGYLEILMKFGVVGAAIFAWYFVAIIRQAFQVARSSDNYFAQVMGLGLVIWLVSALMASVAVSFFGDRGFALTVGVMAGLLPALSFSPQLVATANDQVNDQVAVKVSTPVPEFQKQHKAI
jgi:O-antigen ligase